VTDARTELSLADLAHCFEGAIPVVLATASAAGVPNVTYLSKAHVIDDERVALSNQFLSKSARNLAENPRGSLLLIEPGTHDEYRLTIAFERTERRGRVFDDLKAEVDAIAAMTGMQDVFRLRAADIYRVTDIVRVPPNERADGSAGSDDVGLERPRPAPGPGALAELCVRITRCADLDTLVRVTADGLDQLLGHEHSMLLLLDEDGRRLFTIASHGYEREGVGSEVPVGDGVVGLAAERSAPVRVGNARQMAKYGRSIRRSFEDSGAIEPGREIALPGLPLANSRIAVPALALGQLVGVLTVETVPAASYGEADEAALSVVASLVANAIETIRAEERAATATATVASFSATAAASAPASAGPATHVRFFAVDGSTFLDGDYVIKGVAGRLLWSLLRQYETEGRIDFTNREVRLDPTLDLPDFRDNFESRLIMLKRRLDERSAPIRIEKTGRGRFRLDVDTALRLEEAGA
jgi:predicted pyridoxine 5'-phosphate oxidase superfamily flavin-nucleotide-binding protein